MKDIEKDDDISFANLHLYEIWTLLGSLTHLLQFAIMHTFKLHRAVSTQTPFNTSR